MHKLALRAAFVTRRGARAWCARCPESFNSTFRPELDRATIADHLTTVPDLDLESLRNLGRTRASSSGSTMTPRGGGTVGPDTRTRGGSLGSAAEGRADLAEQAAAARAKAKAAKATKGRGMPALDESSSAE